jgi:hypothetical protein
MEMPMVAMTMGRTGYPMRGLIKSRSRSDPKTSPNTTAKTKEATKLR